MYLQWHGCTAKQPEQVTAWNPQGDPFAMIAKWLLLMVPWRDLTTRHGDDIWVLYVDDRTWIAPTACACVQIGLSVRPDWS